jgi:hypothetical protein
MAGYFLKAAAIREAIILYLVPRNINQGYELKKRKFGVNYH